MTFVTIAEAQAAASRATARTYKTAATLLNEQSKTARESFDVFLSHSYMDREIVLGAKQLLEERNLVVYVDWIDDRELSRDEVNPDTAARLKRRMGQSAALFYLHSPNAQRSKWMPWELGYFDALKGKVAIFPLVTSQSSPMAGQEYLGLYPWVDLSASYVWLNKSGGSKSFAEWPARW